MEPDPWADTPSDRATEINRNRQKTYGDPTPNMELFARLISAYFDIPVSAEDATMVMILLKVMRERQSGFDVVYPDNRVDICGWTNVLEQVERSHATVD